MEGAGGGGGGEDEPELLLPPPQADRIRAKKASGSIRRASIFISAIVTKKKVSCCSSLVETRSIGKTKSRFRSITYLGCDVGLISPLRRFLANELQASRENSKGEFGSGF